MLVVALMLGWGSLSFCLLSVNQAPGCSPNRDARLMGRVWLATLAMALGRCTAALTIPSATCGIRLAHRNRWPASSARKFLWLVCDAVCPSLFAKMSTTTVTTVAKFSIILLL